MRRIHLVTHPEAQHHLDGLVGGWFDSELTERGRLQAGRIAEVLAGRVGGRVVEVWASDLRRAAEAAEVIGRRLGVGVTTDARLRERSNGEADGKPQAWLEERRVPLPEFGDRLGHHDGPTGAETRRELVQRLYPVLEEILRQPVQEQVVVSHGSASSYLIAAWIGMPMEATGRGFFPLKAGSITTLVRNDSHFSHQVVALNETAHLGEVAGG
ncbi:histidine phosphatase family protein [Kribbella sp. NPDC051770]|uniref:histidine phosphatase family protein n=1 Tax=Kribbella sp. NPDC051770 TaxID=3155413 RepID=UPI003413A488